MNELTSLETLVRDVLDAAIEWYRTSSSGDGDTEGIRQATAALQAARGPHALTWGQVPAGWEVQAPNGQWYRMEATRYSDHARKQMVTMLGKEWSRDPASPVTARPGVPNPTDAALAALGWPQVLEDGS